jgi:hypothetical protein
MTPTSGIVRMAQPLKTFSAWMIWPGLFGLLVFSHSVPWTVEMVLLVLSAFKVGLWGMAWYLSRAFTKRAREWGNNACPACTEKGHGYADYAAVPCEVCGGAGTLSYPP